ncbi:hypothetical protein HMPREF1347_01099 [Enterococcus faecium 504]|nr:hypothetical protein HMPREF1347_01099 [Enterococcus faecium 504]
MKLYFFVFLLYKRGVSCQNEKQKEAVTKVLSQPLFLNKRCSIS